MSPTQLVIATLTYLRPDDLRSLLPLLVEQADLVRSADLSVSVLVVDNDPDASARPLVEGFAASELSRGIDVDYVHEPTPGISAGRNRAISASVDKDLLVFIDDDERPSESWLRLLLETMEAYTADVVQGPVLSEYDVAPDEWIQDGGFFRRRRMPTGTPLDVAVTNNLLMSLDTIRALGLQFDPSLGTTGGEDTLFTRQLFRAGAKMIWCDEAVVIDRVPAARSTRQWVVQRALSAGNAAALADLRLADGGPGHVMTRLRLAARGAARAGGGAARRGFGAILRDQRHHARGTRTMMRGLGLLLGAAGIGYHEYGRGGGRRFTQLSRTRNSADSNRLSG